MGNGNKRPRLRGSPHENISERKVGQELAFADHFIKPRNLAIKKGCARINRGLRRHRLRVTLSPAGATGPGLANRPRKGCASRILAS